MGSSLPPYAAVVLAGGAGRRMGGRDKPRVTVDGQSMLATVLEAVADAGPRVVVGGGYAESGLPAGTLVTSEDPPGGGPVAALDAGLARLDAATAPRMGSDVVALMAADLPLLTSGAVTVLREALVSSGADGALFVDADGRRQLLCGVWRIAALRRGLAETRAARGGEVAGAAMRHLVGALSVTEVGWPPASGAGRPPPWYDCDTEDDLRRVRTWLEQEEMSMTALDEWVTAACAKLGIEPAEARMSLVLDLARDVAHQTVRPAAPVTAYLLGVAVGRGAEPEAAAKALTDLAAEHAAQQTDAAAHETSA